MNPVGARDRLMSGRDPRLPTSSAQLLSTLMDQSIDLGDLAASIDPHAVIVGKLISLANSAWSNPIKPVTTHDVACSRLGSDVVRTVSIALTVGRSFAVPTGASFDMQHYWKSSIVSAEIASILAVEIASDAGTARVAGLLHNIGLLWLAECLPSETAAALDAWREDADIGVDAEIQKRCGIGYREAGELLAKRWGLPQALTTALSPLPPTTPNTLHDIVIVAANVTSSLLAGAEQLEVTTSVAGIDAGRLREVFEEQRAKLPATENVVALLAGP